MLVVRDLVKIYPGPVTALAGIDLDVPNGMFGLLGPNGAGKTTLMRILAGLLESSSGLATLDGESMFDRPEHIWGVLGYLPQDFGFFPHLTGEKMLEYLLRLKGVRAARVLRHVKPRLAGAGEPFVRRATQGKDLLGRNATAAGDCASDRGKSPADDRGRADGRA